MNRSILIRNSVVYQSHTKMFGQIFEYCVPGSVGGQYAEPELIHEAHQIMRRTVNFWEMNRFQLCLLVQKIWYFVPATLAQVGNQTLKRLQKVMLIC